ncbi:hypothetical protein FRC17_011013 [Serendipita sp. 399]|nr:hypothetical protein FRC17_011013 [Serendipita sp. 399]
MNYRLRNCKPDPYMVQNWETGYCAFGIARLAVFSGIKEQPGFMEDRVRLGFSLCHVLPTTHFIPLHRLCPLRQDRHQYPSKVTIGVPGTVRAEDHTTTTIWTEAPTLGTATAQQSLFLALGGSPSITREEYLEDVVWVIK